MKLNADILHLELSGLFSVEMTGPVKKELHLLPPRLLQKGDELEQDRLYVAAAEDLPPRPRFPEGVVVVCVGASDRLKDYEANCTVLRIMETCDVLPVYTALQDAFHKYEDWNQKLFELFQNYADLQQFLDCSFPIFALPMFVLNASFGTIASVVPEGAGAGKMWEKDETEISQESMEMFLEESSLALDRHGAFRLKVRHAKPLCVNLYDTADKYIGCLWIECSDTAEVPAHDALAEYLGGILQKVVQRTPSLMVSTHSSIRQVLENLLRQEDVPPSQNWLLNAYSMETPYVCVSFHVLTSHVQMPLRYIANVVERDFLNSIAFPFGQTVVAFLNLNGFLEENGHFEKKLNEKLEPMLYAMKLHCGVSNYFTDLREALVYHRQAEIAFENGSLAMPQLNYHYFTSFILMEMVSNSLGGLPAETYYPEGMKKLLAHDETSDVSYLETLRVFLEENMNFSSAARLLYVHRSTLIDRIHRIESETGIDLSDPNERLHLHLLIKAMELEELIQNQ